MERLLAKFGYRKIPRGMVALSQRQLNFVEIIISQLEKRKGRKLPELYKYRTAQQIIHQFLRG